ncbi:hypothetical protein Tco_0589525, partial [Tanacetum coccineum]
ATSAILAERPYDIAGGAAQPYVWSWGEWESKRWSTLR